MDNVIVTRSGTKLFVKGTDRPAVDAAIAQLVAGGARLLDSVKPLGNNWIATLDDTKPGEEDWCKVTNIGLQSVIEGSSREIVMERVGELTLYGAALIAGPDLVEGKWVAVIDEKASRARAT